MSVTIKGKSTHRVTIPDGPLIVADGESGLRGGRTKDPF